MPQQKRPSSTNPSILLQRVVDYFLFKNGRSKRIPTLEEYLSKIDTLLSGNVIADNPRGISRKLNTLIESFDLGINTTLQQHSFSTPFTIRMPSAFRFKFNFPTRIVEDVIFGEVILRLKKYSDFLTMIDSIKGYLYDYAADVLWLKWVGSDTAPLLEEQISDVALIKSSITYKRLCRQSLSTDTNQWLVKTRALFKSFQVLHTISLMVITSNPRLLGYKWLHFLLLQERATGLLLCLSPIHQESITKAIAGVAKGLQYVKRLCAAIATPLINAPKIFARTTARIVTSAAKTIADNAPTIVRRTAQLFAAAFMKTGKALFQLMRAVVTGIVFVVKLAFSVVFFPATATGKVLSVLIPKTGAFLSLLARGFGAGVVYGLRTTGKAFIRLAEVPRILTAAGWRLIKAVPGAITTVLSTGVKAVLILLRGVKYAMFLLSLPLFLSIINGQPSPLHTNAEKPYPTSAVVLRKPIAPQDRPEQSSTMDEEIPIPIDTGRISVSLTPSTRPIPVIIEPIVEKPTPEEVEKEVPIEENETPIAESSPIEEEIEPILAAVQDQISPNGKKPKSGTDTERVAGLGMYSTVSQKRPSRDYEQMEGLYYFEDQQFNFENHLHVTFDDGPNLEEIEIETDNGYRYVSVTEHILDVLGSHGIRATFFINGKNLIDENGRPRIGVRPLLERMVDEGHTIANHSFNHFNLADGIFNDGVDDVKQIKNEINATQIALDMVLGYTYEMKYFRPPYAEGGRNEKVNQAIQELGLTLILFQMDSYDWMVVDHPSWDREYVISRLKRNIKNSLGGTIMMHELPFTASLLPDVIKQIGDLENNNGKFVSSTLNEMMYIKYSM